MWTYKRIVEKLLTKERDNAVSGKRRKMENMELGSHRMDIRNIVLTKKEAKRNNHSENAKLR
jgi:hypothetical protein